MNTHKYGNKKKLSIKKASLYLFVNLYFEKNDQNLKGVFAKNERGYRLNAIKKRF